VPDAIVVGAGPNGLVAASRLADAGLDVLVLEAVATPGGSVKSAELVEPGFRHDVFSSFYPLGAVSPALAALGLDVRWRRAPLALAHPGADGSCAVLSRDLDETIVSLGVDGPAWRELWSLWRRVRPALVDALVTPLPALRLAPQTLPALTVLLRSVEHVARRFRDDAAARLFAGCALHADLAVGSPGGGLYGFVLSMLGHDVGWPCVERGSGALSAALVARFRGEVSCGRRVERVLVRGGRVWGVRADGHELRAPLVVAAIDAPQLFRLVGPELLPPRLRLAGRCFRWDWATVKVDWTLDGPIPWRAEGARRAAVVHLADSLAELAQQARELDAGQVPARPFVLVGQYGCADASRAPAGKDTAWAYAHVPRGVLVDGFVERIEQRVEEHAPAFGALVRGRHVLLPADLERLNPSLDGGSIGGGTARLTPQRLLLARPETGIAGLYLGSASVYPGPGVHGGPGWIAAGVALRAMSRSQRQGHGRTGRRR
jgi:phytoene dehydrogenase-like protein